MTCGEFESVAPALARSEVLEAGELAAARAHLAFCGPCREVLDAQWELSELLGEVLLEDGAMQAPRQVRQALVRATRRPRPLGERRQRLVVFGCAVAASFVLWAILGMRPHLATPVAPATISLNDPCPFGDAPFITAPFIAVPGSMPGEALVEGRVLRMTLPGDAPAYFGLPVGPDAMLRRVTADIVVGHDGTTRAVRFIPTPSNR